MRLIGYWIESLRDQRYFPPQEFVGDLSIEKREALVRYLANGLVFESYCGYSWCRYSCGISHEAMGSRELTDNEWVWPEGLGHYVAHHQLILPEEFISHVLKGGNMLCDPKSLVEPDQRFWLEWCIRHSSGMLNARVAAARAKADAVAERLREEHYQRLETEHGTSEDKCLWAGCDIRALRGMVFCARCATKSSGMDPGGQAYGGLAKVLAA
jgi:hypothetical protein